MNDKYDEMARELVDDTDEHCSIRGRGKMASAIAALVRREVEAAVEIFAHEPLVKGGVTVCARCGVVVPAAPTCCRGKMPAIRARGGA